MPARLVVTLVELRKIWPSPLPESSQLELVKNSILKDVDGVLLSEPATVISEPSKVADVRLGLFCRLLTPVSPSLKSFAVTPSSLRSIPKLPFEWIAFRKIRLPVLDGT